VSFSIDDVRETFTRDIDGRLTSIEAAARTLVAALPAKASEPPGGAAFSRLEDDFHTIYGTTMLVGAESLASCAEQLERLARAGEQALRELEFHRLRARKIAELCLETAHQMRPMLELELAHRREEAQKKSDAFRHRRVLPTADEIAKPMPAAMPAGLNEFAFESTKSTPDAFDAELREVFDAEGRAAVTELERLLTELVARRDDRTITKNVERIFHTLKGAAASVGLEEPADLAARLQHRLERVLDRQLEIDGGFLKELFADTQRLLGVAGLPALRTPELRFEASAAHATAPAPESQAGANSDEFSFAEDASMDEELYRIFQEEARELVVALRGHLGTVTVNQDPSALGPAERIFHTLKGAAATVGLSEVSRMAGELQQRVQQALDSGATTGTAFLDELLASTNRLLGAAGLGDIVLSREKPAQEIVGGAAAALFLDEARQICVHASALEREFASAPLERAREIRNELARGFHRLKGSALVTTNPDVVKEAQRLQRLAENQAASLKDGELGAGIQRIASLLGFSVGSPGESLGSRGGQSHELVRETVEIVAEPALWATVIQEANELLDAIDKTVLDLEATDQPRQAISSLFRNYHTLKGAVNTAGLTPTGRELHLVEDFLEALRDRPILPSMRGVTSLLLEVQADVRRQLRQSTQGFVEISLPRVEAAITRLLSGGKPRGETGSHSGSQAQSADTGSVRIAASGSTRDAHDVGDRKTIRVATERLDGLMNLAGELVVSRSRLMSRVVVLRSLQQELGRSSRRLVEAVDRFRDEHEFSLVGAGRNASRAVPVAVASPAAERPDTMQAAAPWAAFSELELDRYDDVNVLSRSLAEITNDVNEMNTQLVRELMGFADDSDLFGSIVSGIQSEVTRARMIQLDFLFTRLRLPVRDAAEREHKEVRVVTRGEEVSLDKTIADALFTPMLHLVRNAVVHGVEAANRRSALGKPGHGVITLGAREESGQIVIEVHDDGAGLDLAAMHARGVAMGIIPSDTPLDDPRIKDLVFAPGLTTKATAGAVSGRGVGGDVIRRSIERLNGSIRVDSAPGRGTTFTMSLPVTLSITRALLVRHRGKSFAVPLYFSERILDAAEVPILESAGVRRIKLDGAYLPVRRLDELFGGSEGPECRGPLLILRMGEQRVTLQVDAVLGQEEIVVKNMGDLLTGHPLFAGVTIRGNGELVLIVDVPALIEKRAASAGLAQARPELAAALPAPDPKDELARDVPAPAPVAAPPGKRKIRVLFVDDSLSVRRVAEKVLGALGVEVMLAVDGVDALAKLRESEVDLVFTDLEMPRMHGYDLIRELRFLPTFKDLPIVVVSSRSGSKHQDQARALGANEYLTKPFSPKTIESVLARYCGDIGAARANGASLESI